MNNNFIFWWVDFFEFNKEIPDEIIELLKLREKLRGEKKFAEAYKIREEIEKHGYDVKDHKI